jgi:hypothetical protein
MSCKNCKPSEASNWVRRRSVALFLQLCRRFGRPRSVTNIPEGSALWLNEGPYAEVVVASDSPRSDLGRLGVLALFVRYPVDAQTACRILSITNAVSVRQISGDVVSFTDSVGSGNAVLLASLKVATGRWTVEKAKKELPGLIDAAEEDEEISSAFERKISRLIARRSR